MAIKAEHKHSFKPHIYLIIANILFGINFSFYVSIIKNFMNFETLFFLRVAFAAFCFLPWMIFSRRYRPTLRDMLMISVPTVLVIYGHEFMMLWGAKYTNPVDASTIATMAPIVTLVVSAVMLHEKVHTTKVIGMILGFAGGAFLIFRQGIPTMRSAELGNLLMFVSILAAATNTIFIKPSLMKFGTRMVTGWYYIIGFVITAPFFARGVVDYDFVALPINGILEIAFILVLGTVLPNYLLYAGTEKLTSVHTGLYSYLQPIAATIMGVARGQVDLGINNLISAVLIFAGVILVVITYIKFKFPTPKIS